MVVTVWTGQAATGWPSGLNVEETAERQEAARDERLERGLETHRQQKAKGT
jgi:hypothetical protein